MPIPTDAPYLPIVLNYPSSAPQPGDANFIGPVQPTPPSYGPPATATQAPAVSASVSAPYVSPSSYPGPSAPATPSASPSGHPPNAAYVSPDGLVSYDAYGRRLDSLGHVATSGYHMAPSSGGSTTSTQTSTYAGLPIYYTNALKAIYGAPELYYTPERGGEDQAKQDYQNLLYYLESVYGRYPTDDEISRALAAYQVYAAGLQRQPLASDMFNYLSRYYRRPATPPDISYRQTEEI